MRDSARPFARSPLVEVIAARAARVVFGATLIAGALAVAGTVYGDERAGAELLLATAPVAVVLSLLAARAARLLSPWLARRQRVFGGGPSAPVGALSSPRESARLHALAGHLEPLSYSLPLVGLALVGPLSLHAPLFLLGNDGLRPLGGWIAMSGIVVGLAHVTLALLSLRFARRLYRGTLARTAEHEALRAVGLTTLSACLPGILWLGIPPVLVAITGLLFVPAAFVVIERCCLRERALLRYG